jgi:hypothetical protein
LDFVRTRSYEKGLKRLRKLGASQDDLDRIETQLALDLKAGAVIQNSGGLRKVRFAYGGSGKSGGGRTIYYFLSQDDVIYLLTAYPKVDKDDLTKEELKLFKSLIKELTQ